MGNTVSAREALAALWLGQGLPRESLSVVELTGSEVVLPSSFPVATAAQSTLAAAALCAAEIWHERVGGSRRQRVTVDCVHAALESSGRFMVNGKAPHVWDKLSGLYKCGDAVGTPGWVRIHANFAHHRDGALQLLRCSPGPETERAAVADALRNWGAEDFETAASEAGLVVAAARSFADWDLHPQARALATEPLVRIERIAGAADAPARSWPELGQAGARPLSGLRTLDLTRILAGPVAGRTLAAYGSDVLLVNSPDLPNIDAIADTSRGKRSACVDLKTAAGRETLGQLVAQADVFLQAYRPGAMQDRGFGPAEVARIRPGIVYVSLSAYGSKGPWASRRGFDSLVQTATGFNVAEASAFGATEPRAMPMQVLDYAAGYLLAFGAQLAMLKQAREGGSWHVQVSLAGVGQWLRSLGRIPVDVLPGHAPALEPYLETLDSGFGTLTAVRHAARFSETPARWDHASMPPGTHRAEWLPRQRRQLP